MVLAQAIKILPKGCVACFCVLNPELQNIEPDPELAEMPLEYASKPRETAFQEPGFVGELKSYVAERVRSRVALPRILDRIEDFAARQNVDAVWAVLQGQTMIRLAAKIGERLRMPLFTHVWDPLDWWLQANRVDRWSARQARQAFAAAVRHSRAVSTASPAMSAVYGDRYQVRTVTLIGCHDRKDSYTPSPRLHRPNEIVVGMAGQFYASVEWQTLLQTLDHAGWLISGRRAHFLVLGHYVPAADVPEGRLEFLGWKPQKEAIRILSERADVLYCPYPFDPSMAEVARLSFPSKLVSYLAAGRPILFHGPRDSPPARYLAETGAGLVTTGSGLSNVYDAIERLAGDATFFAEAGRAAQRAFAMDFTLERMRERLLELFDVSEEELAEAPPARVPFDPAAWSAHLPPLRQADPPIVRARRAALAIALQTPLRPLAELTVRGVRAFNRYRRWLYERSASGRRRQLYEQVTAAIGSQREALAALHEEVRRQTETLTAMSAEVREAGETLAAMSAEARGGGETLAAISVATSVHANAITAFKEALTAVREEDKGQTERLAAVSAAIAAFREEFASWRAAERGRSVGGLERANASLEEQLHGAVRSYELLAGSHRFLMERFDSVSSASLVKLDLLSQTVSERLNAAPTAVDDAGSYLDLLETVLTGEVFADPAEGPWAQPGFNPKTRLLGRDWPKTAFSMIGRARMRNIRTLVETILREDIPGDLIETGVWRGGACIYMRALLQVHGAKNRTVWVADSFCGLPRPDADRFSADADDTHHTHPQLAVSVDQVRDNFRRLGLLDHQVQFLEGWFKDTLSTAPIERLALLRLDGDMYESTWEAFEALYDKVAPGGFVIVDDYILPACAKAVEDWRVREHITAPLQEIDGAGVYWRKPVVTSLARQPEGSEVEKGLAPKHAER
jgi:glycosyltransferase involved in cell wall biosynthesis